MHKKLKPKQKLWVVGFHIFFASLWLGSGLCLLMLNLTGRMNNGEALHAINASAKYIDDFVVIPAAIGSLITGLLLSWFTNWGFFAYKWVTIKWIITVVLIIFGTFWLGPWLNGMEAISASELLQTMQDQTYLFYRRMNFIFGNLQIGILVFLIFLSALKPWKKWSRRPFAGKTG